MSKRKPKRIIYRVQFDRKTGYWHVSIDGRDGATEHDTKARAVADAKRLAKETWKDYRSPAQVMICKKNGKFQIEYSYGADNQRRKG